MMLNKQFIYLLTLLIYGSFMSTTFAQTQWTKYENNPVHLYGGQPSVIWDNDTFKMWYAQGAFDSLGLKLSSAMLLRPMVFTGKNIMATH